MVIVKMGDLYKSASSYNFLCKNCGCEWFADRKEVKITPPCLPYEVYMNCPNCREHVEAQTHEQIKKRTRTREDEKRSLGVHDEAC